MLSLRNSKSNAKFAQSSFCLDFAFKNIIIIQLL